MKTKDRKGKIIVKTKRADFRERVKDVYDSPEGI